MVTDPTRGILVISEFAKGLGIHSNPIIIVDECHLKQGGTKTVIC